jgi:hypothetical protein
MGAWGVLAFDNDDAGDWAYGLEETSDLSLVVSTLTRVEQEDEYLEAPEACEALAACEVLARLLGHPGYTNAYTQAVDQWVSAHPIVPSADLLALAKSAIGRILADDSELRELWEESGDSSEWRNAVADLESRLQP